MEHIEKLSTFSLYPLGSRFEIGRERKSWNPKAQWEREREKHACLLVVCS